jgi:hypothetical protein
VLKNFQPDEYQAEEGAAQAIIPQLTAIPDVAAAQQQADALEGKLFTI